MIINLENIFSGSELEIKLNHEFDFSGEDFNGGFPFKNPIKLTGAIKNRVGMISIDAKAEFDITYECDRCMEKTHKDFQVLIKHDLVNELNDEDNDEFILLEDMKLDVRLLTLEDIYLLLPSKLLCNEDCEGICPSCGVNLNEKSCDCKKDIDPRLEALLGFLD
ncbi:MAG: DUF177 domain-containing protein [Clostridia bacterium]